MTALPPTPADEAENGAPRGIVYLLCGLPFSGKSTLADELKERLGAAVVSLDEINARRDLWGGEGVPDEEWAATHRQALREVEDHMRQGVPYIVVDDTHCYRFLRDDHRRLATEHGYRVQILVLRPPLAEIQRRRQEAAQEASRRGIDAEVFENVVANFEWPAGDESSLPVPGHAEPANWPVVRKLIGEEE